MNLKAKSWHAGLAWHGHPPEHGSQNSNGGPFTNVSLSVALISTILRPAGKFLVDDWTIIVGEVWIVIIDVHQIHDQRPRSRSEPALLKLMTDHWARDLKTLQPHYNTVYGSKNQCYNEVPVYFVDKSIWFFVLSYKGGNCR